MARKQKLSLDEIVVESFETSSELRGRGTVHGADDPTAATDICAFIPCVTVGDPCGPTTPFQCGSTDIRVCG